MHAWYGLQQGNTALHLATIHNHSDCVLLLVDNFAQLDVTNSVNLPEVKHNRMLYVM